MYHLLCYVNCLKITPGVRCSGPTSPKIGYINRLHPRVKVAAAYSLTLEPDHDRVKLVAVH